MSEIKSNYSIAKEHVNSIKAAALEMAEEVSIQADGVTNLAVNNNSTALHNSAKSAVSALAEQIASDADQIEAIAAQFRSLDRRMAEVGRL